MCIRDSHGPGRNAREQRAAARVEHGVAIFAHVRVLHRAARPVGKQLHAIADAQHGHAQRKEIHIRAGRAGQIHAAGPAGEDHALYALVQPGFARFGIRVNFGVNAAVAHAAGDELVKMCIRDRVM